MTSGYLKDVQHMKEMIYRNKGVEEIQFYEVQYFDMNLIVEDNVRLLLNDKLANL